MGRGAERRKTAIVEGKGLYNSATRDMKGERMMVLELKAGAGSDCSPRPPGPISFLHLSHQPAGARPVNPLRRGHSTLLFSPRREQN